MATCRSADKELRGNNLDYQFYRGVGVMMAYGLGKIAKKNPAGNFKEWGVFTGFFASQADT
jgi:hypothetical protein